VSAVYDRFTLLPRSSDNFRPLKTANSERRKGEEEGKGGEKGDGHRVSCEHVKTPASFLPSPTQILARSHLPEVKKEKGEGE